MVKVPSDSWSEIGDRGKLHELFNPYRHFKPPPKYEYEASEIVEERRNKNLAILEELRTISEQFEHSGACIHVKIKGLAFDFFPSSGCWISYAKNIYGTGIDRLKAMIEDRLRGTPITQS